MEDIRPQKGPQEVFLSSPADIVIYGGAAGGGKILAHDGVVLTPFGWKKGKDLKVGDLINNFDGTVQRIIQIKPEVTLEKWTVYFSDGTFTEVAEDHLWQAWKGRKGRKIGNVRTFGEASAEVVETRELKEWLERGYAPQIPVCHPQPFNRTSREKNPIDPYLLGVLLGDGCTTTQNMMITCHDDDKDHYLQQIGDKGVTTVTPQTIRFVGDRNKHLVDKLKLHRLLGVKSKDKFIPEIYKYSSIDTRLALIQGLMDTDGYSDPDKNACYFDTVSYDLAHDTAFVLRSLGAVVTLTCGEGCYRGKCGEKIICNDVYHLYIKYRDPDELFRLERKQHGKFGRCLVQKRVADVVIGGTITGRCITVSNPNGLYITNDFIVTHNSYALLLEPLRHITTVKGFGSVVFRRTTPQIRSEGGLWSTSMQIYPNLNAEPKESVLEWIFPPYSNKVKFAHLEYDKNVLDWQGSQIPLICFDELTHFTKSQFFYLLSRNRSMCGVRPYIRATTNPDADSWVAKFIDWWIDDDGFPIEERSGVLRWFVRVNDVIHWGSSKEEIECEYPGSIAKSFTFIPAKLEDNKILEEADPAYRANLRALSYVDNERLEKGNWKIKPEAGTIFKRAWFEIIDRNELPSNLDNYVRFWDLAGTEVTKANKDPDWTVGLKMAKHNDVYYVLDVVHVQVDPAEVKKTVDNVKTTDGFMVPVRMEQEPGSSGKAVIDMYRNEVFQKYNFDGVPSTGSKVARANPVSIAAGAGRIKIVRAPWNEGFLSELEYFPDGPHDDQVDGLSGAFNFLNTFSHNVEYPTAAKTTPRFRVGGAKRPKLF